MPLKLNRYTVYLAPVGSNPATAVETGTYEEHVVTVLHGDQLRCEVAGPNYGMKSLSQLPVAFTTMWCWAALTRQLGKDQVGDWPSFKARVVSLEDMPEPTDPDPESDPDAVVPTVQPSQLLSSSGESSGAPVLIGGSTSSTETD